MSAMLLIYSFTLRSLFTALQVGAKLFRAFVIFQSHDTDP